MRYDQLIAICHIYRDEIDSIVEVGTWNGDRAIQMIQATGAKSYVGYDLFEDATDETDAEESNVKAHFSQDEVGQKIAEACPDVDVRLIKGNTRETLHGQKIEADLAFVDGGHSEKTILGDYNAVKGSKILVLDDVYEGRPGGAGFLVDDDFMVLPKKDPVKDGGFVRMAVRKPYAPPIRLQVKTRNVSSNETIQANIRRNLERDLPDVEVVGRHYEPAVIAAGGPSLDPEAIRGHSHIFCVKSSHDKLIEAGVIPWGCVLLDPRAHVADFVASPHKDVRYFVASMCDPTTFDALDGHKVWRYHAIVGAGEEKILSPGKLLIAGGCSAATRAISLAHALGFREFHLHGFDLCYRDGSEGNALNAEKIRVSIRDREIHQDPQGEYLTDLEKMAQAQEFKHLFKTENDFCIHGEGILSALQPPKNTLTLDRYA